MAFLLVCTMDCRAARAGGAGAITTREANRLVGPLIFLDVGVREGRMRERQPGRCKPACRGAEWSDAMRHVIVVVLTKVATCLPLVLVVTTSSSNVKNPPDLLKVVRWHTLIGSPIIDLITGILFWRAIRRIGP